MVQYNSRRRARGNLRCRFSLYVQSRRHNLNRRERQRRYRTASNPYNKRSGRSRGLASVASLEHCFTAFQGGPKQGEECSYGAHPDRRQHEPGLFRFQTGPLTKATLVTSVPMVFSWRYGVYNVSIFSWCSFRGAHSRLDSKSTVPKERGGTTPPFRTITHRT